MSFAPVKHFRLSPSGSKRWIECPGSARNDLPESKNEASDRGHNGHSMASFRLEIGLPLFGNSSLTEAVRQYVQFVQTLPGEKHYERQIASEIVPEYGGTIDTLAVTPDTIHVADLKSGTWKVPSKDNPQMASYLTLAREVFPGRKRFFATIVQPAVYAKPNTAEFTTKQLDTHISKVIMASTQTNVFRAGEQCRFCPLLPGCGTGQKWARTQRWRAGLDPKP
jgi:hypothetical protein